MIVFYYSIPDLVKRITEEGIRFIRRAKDQDGNSLLNILSVGDEDDSYVKKLLKEVSAQDIFSILEPYTSGLADLDTPLEGYEWDVTYDTTANCVVFRMIETETMPAAIVTPMESAIENALVNKTVSQFFVRNGWDGSLHNQLFEINKENLIGYINRRSGLKRTYKFY